MRTTCRAVGLLLVLAALGVALGAQTRERSESAQDGPRLVGGIVGAQELEPPSALQTYLTRVQGVSRPTRELLEAIAEGLASDELFTRRAASGAMGAVVRAISGIDANPADIELVHRHERVQRALLEATQASDPITRATATGHLGSVAVPYGPRVRDVWLGLLQSDPEARVREMTAYQLGRFGTGDAIVASAVMSALNDPEPRVRKQAALAVSKLRPAGAVPILVARLRTGNEEARFEFAYALIAYGEPARQHLPLLRSVAEGEPRLPARQAIERALQALDQ